MRIHHVRVGMSPCDGHRPMGSADIRRAVEERVAGDVTSVFERHGIHLAVVNQPTTTDPDRAVLYRVRITATDNLGDRVFLEYLGPIAGNDDTGPD